MVKKSFVLDPNAQAYTDDEIVGKVNAAAVAITRADAIAGAALGAVNLDDVGDGETRLAMTNGEAAKLADIEADATADQTGPEIRDLIVAITEMERKIVISDPQTGEFKILAVQRDSTGKMRIDYDDAPIG